MIILDAHCEQGLALTDPGVAALLRHVDTTRGNPRESAPMKCRLCMVPTCLARHEAALTAWRYRNGLMGFLMVVD